MLIKLKKYHKIKQVYNIAIHVYKFKKGMISTAYYIVPIYKGQYNKITQCILL